MPCQTRYPDGSCTWTELACAEAPPLLAIVRGLPSEAASRCVPLGGALPGPVAARIVTERGEPAGGHSVLFAAPGAVVHPAEAGPTNDTTGAISDTLVFLDYAPPGELRLGLSVARLAPSSLPLAAQASTERARAARKARGMPST